MDVVGKYEVKPFTRYRRYIVDILEAGARKHHGIAFSEVDITGARQYIREYKRRTGGSLSNTGWIIKCIGQAVSEHKEVQAYRHGNGKLVLFDDVDVWLAIETPIGEEREIRPYVMRKVNEKSVKEIHDEIRRAQVELAEKESAKRRPGTKRRRDLLDWPWPKFLRKLWGRKVRRNAFYAKKIMGTVAVTTPSLSPRAAQWNVGVGLHPLILWVGLIKKKPGVIDDKIEIREYIHLTILVDHDIADGAPINRFIERLTELMESAYGLVD